jgi:hypothetical protein
MIIDTLLRVAARFMRTENPYGISQKIKTKDNPEVEKYGRHSHRQ